MKHQLLMVMLAMTLSLYSQNESKLVIEASSNQTNNNPLVRLRTSNGIDLLWLHSDLPSNTFVGFNTGYKNNVVGGNANTFIGSEVGYNNTTGSNNTAVGYAALYKNSGNNYNTAVGSYALQNTIASDFNTALGYGAGDSYNNGYNNVFIGANTDVNQNDLFNVIAIGQSTVVSASSTARFGNSATGSYGGWANWSNVSDGRYKKNIKADVPGLDFILRLEPVTYNLDVSGLSKALGENQGKEWDQQTKNAIADKEKLIQTGFIAQDVEKIAKTIGYNFSGVDAAKNEKDFYGLRYAEFVVPLVKAVQELNEELNAKNTLLNAELITLRSEIGRLSTNNEKLINRLEKVEALIGVGEMEYTSLDSISPSIPKGIRSSN